MGAAYAPTARAVRGAFRRAPAGPPGLARVRARPDDAHRCRDARHFAK
jgi:hypothetical protein